MLLFVLQGLEISLNYNSQPAITCLKLVLGKVEQGVKYIQS